MLTSNAKIVIECSGEFRFTVLPGGRVEIEIQDASNVFTDGTLYDKKGLAKRLGTSVRSIENWMNQKRHPLPYIKHCGHPKFREEDIQWWLAQGCSVASRRARNSLGQSASGNLRNVYNLGGPAGDDGAVPLA